MEAILYLFCLFTHAFVMVDNFVDTHTASITLFNVCDFDGTSQLISTTLYPGWHILLVGA